LTRNSALLELPRLGRRRGSIWYDYATATSRLRIALALLAGVCR
jgi:hypothetical protein